MPNLSPAQCLELAELEYTIKKRKYHNPLSFFKPLRMQKAFDECESKIKGLFGGNRSGKTEEGAAYVVSQCERYEKLRVWACAETFQDSVNIQQRKVFGFLPRTKLRYAFYDEVNGFRNRKVIFENGSAILFKSYDQGREAFQSDDCDIIWNDEEPSYDICREQRMRLIDRDGELIFTLTALKGITEFISEYFDGHEIVESEYAPLVDEVLPRIVKKNDATFFMLWTTENPHISQERLLSDARMMSRAELKSRIYGVPTNLAGRIYPMYTKRVHVINPDAIPTTGVTLYHVLDPHDRKPWAMQWWAVDKRGTAYCVREYPWGKNFNDMDSDDKTYEDYAGVIREAEEELFDIFGRSVYKRIIDPNFGNATVQLAKRIDNTSKTTPVKELRRLGFKFEDGYDKLEPGHLAVRQALHYEEKDGEIIYQPKTFVSELCINTDSHLSKYSHKDLVGSDGDEKAKPGLTQKYKDYCDLVRYFWMAGPQYVDKRPFNFVESPKRY